MEKLEKKYQELLNMPACLQDLKTKEKYKLVDYLEEKIFILNAELSDLKDKGLQFWPDGKYSIEWAEKYNQLLQAKSVKDSIEKNLYPARQSITEENQGENFPEYHVFHWLNGPEQDRLIIWNKVLKLANIQPGSNLRAYSSFLRYLNKNGYFKKGTTEEIFLKVGSQMLKIDLSGEKRNSSRDQNLYNYDFIPHFSDMKY